MTSPRGAKVTVAQESVAAMEAAGFRRVATPKAADKPDEKPKRKSS